MKLPSVDEMRARIGRGQSQAEVAREFGVTRQAVSKALKTRSRTSNGSYLIDCENCDELGFVTRCDARFCSKDCKDVAGHRRRRAAARTGEGD